MEGQGDVEAAQRYVWLMGVTECNVGCPGRLMLGTDGQIPSQMYFLSWFSVPGPFLS